MAHAKDNYELLSSYEAVRTGRVDYIGDQSQRNYPRLTGLAEHQSEHSRWESHLNEFATT